MLPVLVPGPAAGATYISISATPSLRNVDPGTYAVFTLNLRNDGNATDVVTLDITGLPKNWTSLFSDDSVELTAGKTASTSLSIKPPKDSRTMDATLNVSALSMVTSGKVYVNLKVHVNQVYKLDLQVPALPAATPGGSTTVSATIRNDGNGPDHVTVMVIPIGASTSWASVASATYDIAPGESKVYSQALNVPSDTSPDRYQFMVRARSTGPDLQETKTVDLEVNKGALAGLVLDMTMIIIIVTIVFVTIIILAAVLTPKGKGAKPKEEPKTEVKPRKVKKVSRKDDDAHKKHLERIEKRIDELHDKVEKLHDNHRETMKHYDEHLAKHHGTRRDPEPLPPPPKPVPESPPQPPKDFSPSAQAESLKPEGPPENMSLGDEHGELKKRPEGLKTTTPAKGKCPKCGGEVELGWVKCPTCSTKL